MTLIYYIKPSHKNEEVEVVKEDVTRKTCLNDAYYEDPNAFCAIANALGFPK